MGRGYVQGPPKLPENQTQGLHLHFTVPVQPTDKLQIPSEGGFTTANQAKTPFREMKQPMASQKLASRSAHSYLLNAARTPTKACKDIFKPSSAWLIPAELPLIPSKAYLNPWNSGSIKQHPNLGLYWIYSAVKQSPCSAAIYLTGTCPGNDCPNRPLRARPTRGVAVD